MDRGRDWHKLWRDMLWAIPRGNPQSRLPYEQRAAGQCCKEGQDAWADLVRYTRARSRNEFCTAAVAGSLWLGAQAQNAEGVSFVWRVEQNLVLHFWPLTSLVFAPQVIKNEGESEFVGYALAIPEVARLEYFCEDYPEMLHSLPTEVRGFRPAAAAIDLPVQAALGFMESLAMLAQRTIDRKRLDTISAVEFLHIAKLGNNIKTMAAGRVAPKPELLDRYMAIVGAPCKQPYRNPLFRSGLLLSLLRSQQRPTRWYECMAAMLVERPWPFFIRCAESPRNLSWFSLDAAKHFDSEQTNHDKETEVYRVSSRNDPTAGSRPEQPLSLLIHRLVRTYVQRRTEEKCGIKWENFKDRKVKDEQGRERIDVPKEYTDAKEKVASEAFLAMRSRREQDFVAHFTAVFCQFRQFLPEDDFCIVAESLLNQPDNVKTLTLLALSANS